jgi:transcriptional regulator with XRE-family HTH domain
VDIEDYTELSVSTLSRLENSKANISFDSLISVLDLLGLEMQIRIKKTV